MALKLDFLSDYIPEKSAKDCPGISLKERSVTYVAKFEPHAECKAYQVDGYIIKGTDKDKCDKVIYAKFPSGNIMSIFVELKGSDVAHAIKQLEATLRYPLFEERRKSSDDIIKARIVVKSVPSNSGKSVVERAKADFHMKYKCKLLIKKPGQPDLLKGSESL